MKIFNNLSERNFDSSEYNALREEQNLRLNIIYSHGFTLASVILVFFSAVLIFVAEILKISMDDKSIFGQAICVDFIIIFAIAVFCTFPVILVYSFSAKYEDTLRQICSIAAYQKVFFEYPSLIKKDLPQQNPPKKEKSDKEGIKAWELFHCNSKVPKAKLIASEYVAISVMSIALSVILGIALCICSCVMNYHYFYVNYLAESTATICIFALCFVSFEVVMGRLIYKTRKNTRGDSIIKKYSDSYFEEYLQRAVDYGLLSEENASDLWQLNKEMSDWDGLLEKELNEKTEKKQQSHDQEENRILPATDTDLCEKPPF